MKSRGNYQRRICNIVTLYITTLLLFISILLWIASYRDISYTFSSLESGTYNDPNVISLDARAGCLYWTSYSKAGSLFPDDVLYSSGFSMGHSFDYFTLWTPEVTRSSITGLIWEARIPMWIPTVIFGILPSLWAMKWWRRYRRLKRGRCTVCGYSLFGLNSSRCPECGTEFDPELLKKLQTAEPAPGETE
ncbi:MAG: hypothetical protein HJJLKODD_02712 [Phycisphaerae bacterium]|nr:hypothetical protein [Phycisphaerae bacterium]